LTQYLRIVHEVDRRFAEPGSAACEAWTCPIENAVFERERGTDGARSCLDGEELAVNVEVRGHVATIDAQKLATANVILASPRRVNRRASIKRHPRSTSKICAASQRICSRVWLNFEHERRSTIPSCVIVRNWDHSGCRLDYGVRSRACCVNGTASADILCDCDQFRKSIFAQQADCEEERSSAAGEHLRARRRSAPVVAVHVGLAALNVSAGTDGAFLPLKYGISENEEPE